MCSLGQKQREVLRSDKDSGGGGGGGGGVKHCLLPVPSPKAYTQAGLSFLEKNLSLNWP